MTNIDDLKSKPCLDCGGTFPPVCMDFDHRDPADKSGPVASFLNDPVALRAEIAKCDLVCANCHRIRTAKRGDISSRVKAKMREKRERGEKTGGSRPYGFDVVDGVLVENDEQTVIAEMRALRSQGYSYNSIAQTLNAKGTPSAGGGRWYGNSVRRVLS